MLNFKGMRFPIDVILVCIRWYAAYPLSYRHLEEMMEERGVSVDHSSINRWAIRFLPLIGVVELVDAGQKGLLFSASFRFLLTPACRNWSFY